MIRMLSLAALLVFPQIALAELKMSPVFGDSMVVQRDMPIHIWGWTTPGTEVKVEMAGHQFPSTTSRAFRLASIALPMKPNRSGVWTGRQVRW